MNFGVQNEQDNAHKAWQQYAAQLEHLKASKGPDHEDVKKAQTTLDEYYRSPAYAAWYEDYQKRIEEHKQVLSEPQQPHPAIKNSRNLPLVEVSADEALERAEEEQRLGVPVTFPEPETEEGGATNKTTEPEEAAAEAASMAATKRKRKGPPEWYEITDEKNTHVYVSGLPPNITEAAFAELMSKCGIIMNDPLTEKLRIKLYRDAVGNLKGDGRCCYIKVSIALFI